LASHCFLVSSTPGTRRDGTSIPIPRPQPLNIFQKAFISCTTSKTSKKLTGRFRHFLELHQKYF
jgi:hypothetical protein